MSEFKIGARTLIRRLVIGGKIEHIPTAFLMDQDASLEMWLESMQTVGVQKAKLAWRDYERRAQVSIEGPAGQLVLRFAEHKGWLRWTLNSGPRPVGAGRLKAHVDSFDEGAAAIFPTALRGHRLYPKILRAIRTQTGLKVYSDNHFLGMSAIKAWKRMGLFDPEHGRFLLQKRDNPPARFYTLTPYEIKDLASAFTVLAT